MEAIQLIVSASVFLKVRYSFMADVKYYPVIAEYEYEKVSPKKKIICSKYIYIFPFKVLFYYLINGNLPEFNVKYVRVT